VYARLARLPETALRCCALVAQLAASSSVLLASQALEITPFRTGSVREIRCTSSRR